MDQFDREYRLHLELMLLQEKIRELSLEELERDLAEVSIDIVFLEAQLRADLGSYSPRELEEANDKISHIKQRGEILKIELNQRTKSPASDI